MFRENPLKKGWTCKTDGFCKLQDVLLAKGEVKCAGCKFLLEECNFSYDALDAALATDDGDGDDQGDANAKVQEGQSEGGKGEEEQGDKKQDEEEQGEERTQVNAGYAFARSSSHGIQAALFCSRYSF